MPKTSLGLGLAAIGRPDYINIRSQRADKSLAAFKQNTFDVLDKAYSLGLRDFDVAASYGYGEQFLLEWQSMRNYKDIRISSKWGYTYMANWEIGYSGKHEIKEHSLTKLKEQWSYSQQFLPWLKIYQIHSATLESGVLDNWDVLNYLNVIKNQHKIKIGISTSGPYQTDILQKAETIVLDDSPLFDAYQVTYNILEQSTYAILRTLIKNGKTIIVKEALANGRLFNNPDFPHYSEVYTLLNALSRDYNTNIDSIALRFIMDTIQPDLVLSGAANSIELESNTSAVHLELGSDDLEKLIALRSNSENYWAERSGMPWQ